MKTVFRVLAVLGALALLRLALPLGLAWVHYLSTPDFRDWAETHPSGDSLWREVIPEGVLIAEGLPWESHPIDRGAEPRTGALAASVEMWHGDEILLDLDLLISYRSQERAPDGQVSYLTARSMRRGVEPCPLQAVVHGGPGYREVATEVAGNAVAKNPDAV